MKRSDMIELAYGLLWALPPGPISEISTTQRARRELLTLLDKAGQARGITAARAVRGQVQGATRSFMGVACKHPEWEFCNLHQCKCAEEALAQHRNVPDNSPGTSDPK